MKIDVHFNSNSNSNKNNDLSDVGKDNEESQDLKTVRLLMAAVFKKDLKVKSQSSLTINVL
jgi:hypothetical protein